MGKRKKVAHVVLKGHQTGIFETWAETQQATQGFKKTAHAASGPEFQGYFTREEAERAWREKKLNPDGPAGTASVPGTARPKKKAKVDATPLPPASTVQPLPLPPSEGDLGRKHDPKERKAVPLVIAYREYEANGSDAPPPFTGKYACVENTAFLEMLNKHGQPCNANPAARGAFLTRFRYRSRPSVDAHSNHYNLDEYKTWRGGDNGRWVGFQWRPLE
jgi:hypothetical protein